MTRLYHVLPFSLISTFPSLLVYFDFVWWLFTVYWLVMKKEENGWKKKILYYDLNCACTISDDFLASFFRFLYFT